MSVLFISLFVLALDEKARAITITIYYVIVHNLLCDCDCLVYSVCTGAEFNK